MKIRAIYLLAFILVAGACKSSRESAGNDEELSVIPKPVMVKLNKGIFTFNINTAIYYHSHDLMPVAGYLGNILSDTAGFKIKIKEGSGKGINLRFAAGDEKVTGDEGYRLNITPGSIDLYANKSGGIFYGIQTLLQMLPPGQERGPLKKGAGWEIPCADINDYPRFSWRGLLLDVSRHFFTVDEIKRLIDQMVIYKFNILQLHLTDDQGWRLEIKKLPELTRTGAWRVPRTGLWWERDCPQDGEKATYGGFYTQDEIKDLISYASTRNVNILPEIEAPGHSLAAIASYPHLSSTGLKYKVNPGCRFYTIEDNSLCAGKESTYDFMNTVLSEVAGLFPFKYVHIGGDECYKGFWKKCPDCQRKMKENGLKDENELQSYFIKRIEKILEENGKKLIGWDEILEGGLAPNATVMSWRGMKGGIIAARSKHHVVMTPVDYAYLDFYQGDPAIEPPTYAMLRLKKVYDFEPVPDGVDSSYILGGQGNLWTESVPTFRHAEYMLWPRSFALAEVLWSKASGRDWPEFVRRMEVHLKRLSIADINYARSFYDAIIIPYHGPEGSLQIELGTEIEDMDIYYTFDNTYPDHHSPLYKTGEKLSVPKDADTFSTITYKNGKPAGRIITIPISELEKRANQL